MEKGIKESVAEILINLNGGFMSGELIADKLGVSRSAVWKAVKRLKNEGFSVEAVSNKGYTMNSETKKLSETAVKNALSETLKNLVKIEVVDYIGSTNDYLKEKAQIGFPEWHTVLAETQTAGKGRRGRSFCSPRGSGLYMSVILRPNPEIVNLITACAAIAVTRAVAELSGKKPLIKWVNDVFLDGKKICGILTEASFSMENFGVDYAVLGIGINVYSPANGFPPEISDICGSIFNENDGYKRNKLCALILNNFYALYTGTDKSKIAKIYREYNFVIGKRIEVIRNDGKLNAKALNTDEDCRLVVRYDNGAIETLNSGEVSVKVEKL